MYGRLENGALILAPRIITAHGKVYYNPTEELYQEMGFLPIIQTPYPTDGNCYTEVWQEQDGEIVRVWIESENTEAHGMTQEERLCQTESELASLKAIAERMNAEIMYLCMMGGIEPTEVSL